MSNTDENPFGDGGSKPSLPVRERSLFDKGIDLKFDDHGAPEYDGGVCQYSIMKGGYLPVGKTVGTLAPDCYKIGATDAGIIFMPQKIVTDNLLRLPDSKSDEVIEELERFWTLKHTFKEYGFAHKRGVLLYGPPGCHGRGTQILMFDGSLKNVEDVQVGDRLMGPDSSPRTVLKLARGKDKMVRITPVKGESFIVNYNHILHLTPSHVNDTFSCALNLSVEDYIENTSKVFKDRFKLKRTKVEFSEQTLSIDPYILGLWLGDGNTDSLGLTTIDAPIKRIWADYGKKYNLKIKAHKKRLNARCETIMLSAGNFKGVNPEGRNPLLNKFKTLGLMGNKHIPQIYLSSSRKQRLELLAGLIDSDGHATQKECRITKTKFGSGYDYITKLPHLAEQFVYLCRSLGFAAYLKKCTKGCYVGKHKYFSGTYYRVSVSGHLEEVPVRLERKKCKKRKQIKNVLHTGFSYEVLPEDNYYGFSLDKDHLYLTGDFTIHHNSGKSSTLRVIGANLINKGGVVFIGQQPAQLSWGLSEFRKIEPNKPCVVVLEDIDTIIRTWGESEVLALLDGESQIENVVYIATTNYPENLDGRVINRPSRFDRIVKIDMPNLEARKLYLTNKIQTHMHNGVDLAAETEGLSIAHLKELIVGVFCQQNSLQETLQRLKKMKYVPKSSDSGITMGIK